jgi:hypothetical protein
VFATARPVLVRTLRRLPPSTPKENHMKFISSKTHTYIGAVVGVALVIAPWIFQFDEVDAAKWSAIGVGLSSSSTSS